MSRRFVVFLGIAVALLVLEVPAYAQCMEPTLCFSPGLDDHCESGTECLAGGSSNCIHSVNYQCECVDSCAPAPEPEAVAAQLLELEERSSRAWKDARIEGIVVGGMSFLTVIEVPTDVPPIGEIEDWQRARWVACEARRRAAEKITDDS